MALVLVMILGLFAVVWLGQITEVGSLQAGLLGGKKLQAVYGRGGIGNTRLRYVDDPGVPNAAYDPSRLGGEGFGSLPDDEIGDTGFSINPGSGGGVGDADCISLIPEMTDDYLEALSAQQFIALLECFGSDGVPLNAVTSREEQSNLRAEIMRRGVNIQMSESEVVSAFVTFDELVQQQVSF